MGWELFNSLTPEDKRLILEAIDELEEVKII
jgi:TRAP-type C4-dicarboxylate transport system substrate-binding protein